MLPSSQRLSAEQFNLVMEKGRVVHSAFFWLKSLKYDGNTRISATVPQKVLKKAVERNGYRRRMYISIRNQITNIPDGFLVILCAKEQAIGLNDQDFIKEIKIIFEKSGLLK